MAPEVKPWRFVVLEDYPAAGLMRGDMVTACAGRPTRVIRCLPVNPGLLLNLAMDGVLVEVEGFVGDTAPAAQESSSTELSPTPVTLKVVR